MVGLGIISLIIDVSLQNLNLKRIFFFFFGNEPIELILLIYLSVYQVIYRPFHPSTEICGNSDLIQALRIVTGGISREQNNHVSCPLDNHGQVEETDMSK